MDNTPAAGQSDGIADRGIHRQGNHSYDVKKTKLQPQLMKQWCIPAQYNAEFVARMEDILEVYALPCDEQIPLICMDEQPFQMLGEKLEPIPMSPGHPRKESYEYVRKGTCSIFVFTEPLDGFTVLPYVSGGYDAAYVEYFQIVQVSPSRKSVTYQEITSREDHSGSPGKGRSYPVPGKFVGEPKNGRVQTNGQGKPHIRIGKKMATKIKPDVGHYVSYKR